MKRSMPHIFIVILLLSATTACQKYLDVNAQSDFVYISSISDCQALLDDYNGMNNNSPVEQLISADEYYVTDASLLTIASQPQEVLYYSWDPEAIRPFNSGTTDWNAAYKKIYVANLVLENVEKLRKASNPEAVNNAEGGALFHRAYNLWFLAQLYAKPYQKATAMQDAGVPVRTTSDINETITRGTVENTYGQVISDLKKAAEILPDTALLRTRASKAAAYAMLARVYLSMADYPAALENATLSLAIEHSLLDYNQLSTTSNTPFARFNKEVLFHTVSRSSSSILNPGTGLGGIAKIVPELIASYTEQDLRKQVMFKQNTGADEGTYRFSGNYEEVNGTSLFAGIAVDEMYITRAECYARQGNTTAAMKDLNDLLKTRYTNTTPYVDRTATTADEALTIILEERKKELMLRGLRWTDLRRLNQTPATAITLTRVLNGVTRTLPPNDLRYTLLIPTEVIAGANVSQNPR